MEFGQRSVRLPKTPMERLQWRRAVVILEHCPLQTIMTKSGFELLREKHRLHHAKHKTDPAQWRPDVVHQCLLHLLDSPLNRSGRLQVFVRTTNGVLIAIDPRLRVPRAMRLFEIMMTRLLFKLKIRSTINQTQLLRVVRNPITEHLPDNTQYIRVEKGGRLEDPVRFCKDLASKCGGIDPASSKSAAGGADAVADSDDEGGDGDGDGDGDGGESDVPIWERVDGNQGEKAHMRPFAFVIGGMARGDVEADYADKESTVAFSTKPMSAAAICSMLCHSLEMAWLGHDYSHAMDTFA